jgi:hypothetical protein
MLVPDQLISDVLALPPAARAELRALLQASLPIRQAPGAIGSDDQLAAEWTEELDRRIAGMRGGESRGVDAEAAFALLRTRLGSGQGSH